MSSRAQFCNQSPSDFSEWCLFNQKKGEDNLVLRQRLARMRPDLARLYVTRELRPDGQSLDPPVFIEFVLAGDRPFIRHVTGHSGNSANAFGGRCSRPGHISSRVVVTFTSAVYVYPPGRRDI